MVSPATPAGATIAYGKTPAPATPARPPAARIPPEGRKADADVLQTVDDSMWALVRSWIKPIHAIVAAVGVLLLLGLFLLLRSGSPAPKPAPVAAPKPTPAPATIAKPAAGPTVAPLPAPAPAPPVAAPQPAPLRASEAKAPLAKRLQPAPPSAVAPVGAAKSPAAESFDVDKFLRDQDQRKAQALGPAFDARAKRWHDPFADTPGASAGAKQPKMPASSPATEPPRTPKRPSRKQPLIEEL